MDSIRGLCQYQECITTNSKICKFPFKYKGRLYDTCITIDSNSPWCSLKVDKEMNHIEGLTNKGICNVNCTYTNCPVGFFENNNNCYQLSAKTIHDAVSNISDANLQCMKQGARLFQPRDVQSIQILFKSEATFLKPTGSFFRFTDEQSFISIGAQSNTINPKIVLKYLDKSRAYVIEKMLANQTVYSGTIPDFSTFLQNENCIMFNKNGEFSVDICSSFYTGVEPQSNILGFMCEAKQFMTIAGPNPGKTCYFPFKPLPTDPFSTTCIIDYVNEGSWCATDVDKNGVMIAGKWGKCDDEREIAYKGDGAGKQCKLPYLYDRVWHDKCVLQPREEIWCPTSLSLAREFDEGVHQYGYCTDYLKPASSDCTENYENVGGICIRVSPLAEQFDFAQKKCMKEGGNLLTILDGQYINYLKPYVTQLQSTKTYFNPTFSPDLTSYWIGGSAKDLKWSWLSSGKNFSGYTNWIDGKNYSGCVESICTDNYGLSLNVPKRWQWEAADKSKSKPYICESKCKVGYRWYSYVKKCLKVVDVLSGKSRGDAMLACAADKARLVSLTSCEDFVNLGKDVWYQFQSAGDQFWIGFFAGDFSNFQSRRTTSTALDSFKSINSQSYITPNDCAFMNPNFDGSIDVSGSLTIHSSSSTGSNLELHEFIHYDDDVKKGYICEPEVEWTCPEGYILYLEDCYMYVNASASFSEAQVDCQSKNGYLVEPQHIMQSYFILHLAKTKNSTVIWTGYRRNIFSLQGQAQRQIQAPTPASAQAQASAQSQGQGQGDNVLASSTFQENGFTRGQNITGIV